MFDRTRAEGYRGRQRFAFAPRKRACQAHASSGAGSWKGKKGDVGKDKGKKGKGDKGSWHNKGYDQAKGYKGYANFKGNVKGKFGGGKGKERGKKSFGSGFGSPGGKGKGPCFICGRMGHRAAECHLRVRVQQVAVHLSPSYVVAVFPTFCHIPGSPAGACTRRPDGGDLRRDRGR